MSAAPTASRSPVALRWARALACAACASGLAAVRPVAAQPAATPQEPYALPASPAFNFLGLAPTEVSQPTSARALLTDVVSAIDSSGRVRQGLAIDFAPWAVTPTTISLSEYQQNRWKYIYANTQASVATVKSSGDSASTDLALGLRATLFNAADPMGSPAFISSLDTRRETECGLLQDIQPGEEADYDSCLRRVATEVRAEWLSTNWNKPALSVAAASGWSLEGGHPDSTGWRGAAAWLTAAFPLGAGTWGQGLVQAGYEYREPGASGPSQHAFAFGARGLFGTESYNLYLEYTDALGLSADGEPGSRVSGGVEYRVAEGTWLSTGIGRGLEGAGSADRTFVIANVRYEIAGGPRLR